MPSLLSRSLLLLGLALIGAAFLGLTACGGGGGDSGAGGVVGGGGGPLTITTTTLPAGSLQGAYGAAQLIAANGQGTLTWSLAAGGLPAGLDLDGSGVIAGTPTEQGLFVFTVRVEDEAAEDTRDLAIGIDTLALAATSGVVAGEAWTQCPVTLSTFGQTGSVTFEIVTNESGGALGSVNPTAGTATWTPGHAGGIGVVDVIRATESGDGSADLDLPVMPDPAEGYTASFGSTDVWWIDPNLKYGNHAYATDLVGALAAVGLRDPASTGAVGTEADEVAAAWFRVELRRWLNPMFLRNADGSAGAQGLPICFPFDEPGPGYSKPSSANWFPGAPTGYSQMALIDGTQSGVIGTAFIDTVVNDRHENDTTTGGLELGVFANQLVGVFNAAYGNPLVANPIGAADVPALRALLHELPSPGGRYAQLRTIGQGFARSVAAVVAHEIGHSLGLDHNGQTVQGAIMNAAAMIHPTATYTFTADNVALLQGALPGTGRGTGAQKLTRPTGAAAQGGGVRVCNCRIHTSSSGGSR